MADAWRLAVGTWTSVRIKPPREITPRVAGRAIALGPLLGLALGFAAGAVSALPLLTLGRHVRGFAMLTPSASVDVGAVLVRLLCAVIAVALLAWLTRVLHIDGLADTADGFGSGRQGEAALEVMKRSDIGPFGVLTVLLVLLGDVVAIALLSGTWLGVAVVVIAVMAGRLAPTWLCLQGTPPARADGLGATVIGTVRLTTASIVTLLVVAAGVALTLLGNLLVGHGSALSPMAATSASLPLTIIALVGAAIGAALVVGLLRRRAIQRFGGITGDVLGASVELTTMTILVVSALVAGLAANALY